MSNIKITIYDWMGYFIPGALVIWAISELFSLIGISINKMVFFNFHISIQSVLLLILSYTIGHLLHGIANFSIDFLPSGSYPPKNYFPEEFKSDFSASSIERLIQRISEKFEINFQESEELNDEIIEKSYWLCYSFIISSGKESLSQLFLSLSGFYRGLAIGSLFVAFNYSICYLVFLKIELILISLLCILIGLLFLSRVKRFKRYLAKSVYSDFLTFY